jgi:hypothetical protein
MLIGLTRNVANVHLSQCPAVKCVPVGSKGASMLTMRGMPGEVR